MVYWRSNVALQIWGVQNYLKKGAGGGGDGSNLPLNGKGSGGEGWNALKPEGPGPRDDGGGGGLGSINGGKMGLTGGGPPLLLSLFFLFSFGDGVMPFNLSNIFFIFFFIFDFFLTLYLVD